MKCRRPRPPGTSAAGGTFFGRVRREPRYDAAVSEPEARDRPTLEYEAPPPPPVVPRYRRIFAAAMIAAGGAAAVFGFLMQNESARVNTWTVAFGLIVWGLVVRFQHVRL